MDVTKMIALVAVEKIPRRALVKWTKDEWQHWPSVEEGRIHVFQAYYKCGFQLPCHLFPLIVLEHFEVELVNLVPNSITMLSIFMYLCEAYLGIALDLDLFRYYYGMGKHRLIAGSCGFQLHNVEGVHPHVYQVVVVGMEEEVVLLDRD